MKIIDLLNKLTNNNSIEEVLKNLKIESINPLFISGRYMLFDRDADNVNNDIKLETNKYYIYDEIGHTGDWIVREMDSLKDVEDYILSPGGYLNMFCSDLKVLYNLKLKEYKVYENINNNKVYVRDFEECTDKSNLNVEWI